MREEHRPQFACPDCDAGFNQRSAYERHRAASHPQPAPTAADLAKAVAGTRLPARLNDLVAHARSRGASKEITDLIRDLPDRLYRDAAELGRALGELKSRGQIRGDGEAPSVRGGKAAARGTSAAAVARMLAGARFPCGVDELRRHASANRDRVDDPDAVIRTIERLPQREYENMADVERGVGEARLG